MEGKWIGAVIIKHRVPYYVIPMTAYTNNFENVNYIEDDDKLVLIHSVKDKAFTLFDLQYVDIFETTDIKNYNNFINTSNRIDTNNNLIFYRHERIK